MGKKADKVHEPQAKPKLTVLEAVELEKSKVDPLTVRGSPEREAVKKEAREMLGKIKAKVRKLTKAETRAVEQEDESVDAEVGTAKIKETVQAFADKIAKEKAWELLRKKMEKALDEHGTDEPCEHCEDPTIKCQAEQVRILYKQGFKIGDIARLLGVPYHQAYNPIFRLNHPYVGKKERLRREQEAAGKGEEE